MQVKQFLLQLKYDERCHWIVPDEILAEVLAELSASAGRTQSDGTIPEATVFPVVDSTWRADHKIVALTLKEAISK
jgi:hypothetical protein